MSFHNGFYLDKESLIRELGEQIDFGFLGNEPKCKNFGPDDFLHGYCDIFACMLHDKYGYPIEKIIDEDGLLIHAYCVCKQYNRTLYMDIRGATDNWEEFLEEFDDFMPEYSWNITTGYYVPHDSMSCIEAVKRNAYKSLEYDPEYSAALYFNNFYKYWDNKISLQDLYKISA